MVFLLEKAKVTKKLYAIEMFKFFLAIKIYQKSAVIFNTMNTLNLSLSWYPKQIKLRD